MASPDPADDFTVISTASSHSLFPTFEASHSAPIADNDVPFTAALRKQYPELNVTTVPTTNAPLVQYAALGHATATLDTETDSLLRWRGYVGPAHRGGNGSLGDAIFFAKYHYTWGSEDFILFTVGSAFSQLQYILKEPSINDGENTLSHCAKTDALIWAVVAVMQGDADKYIYIFDNYWMRSRELWEQVQHASWDKVILNPSTKHALTDVAGTFFDSEETYRKYGVPWKRGVIFHGPPGNGKTISIKALMKTLYDRKDPVPSLYVKAAPATGHLKNVFQLARSMSPCMLIFEDIETIVSQSTRSYFFNEVDGLASNDGILMVASTNYLERLDPGLSKRPSRFDRKYLFPLPDANERALYCAFWRKKLEKSKSDIPFPTKLDKAIAGITDKFSFAYLQEAFIASLLIIAREGAEEEDGGVEDVADLAGWFDGVHSRRGGGDGDELRGYKLWRVMKKQVAMLRREMGDGRDDAIAKAKGSGDLTMLLNALQGMQTMSLNDQPRERERDAWPSSSAAAWFDAVGDGLPVSSADARTQVALSGSTANEDMPRTVEQMLGAGIGKKKIFTESAFEWRQ
ncbi:hypothetical protein FH972_021492 [Carpinus fangiana]|uniref:AAA+ ATPase domain-containing protein n=1 Tax=Carpinus fangiana TaxID=176857 RepID=A0A5N6KQ25_9ROSI|nr:hypothetical protein FH972_021492 [Carpinus fangiana]